MENVSVPAMLRSRPHAGAPRPPSFLPVLPRGALTSPTHSFPTRPSSSSTMSATISAQHLPSRLRRGAGTPSAAAARAAAVHSWRLARLLPTAAKTSRAMRRRKSASHASASVRVSGGRLARSMPSSSAALVQKLTVLTAATPAASGGAASRTRTRPLAPPRGVRGGMGGASAARAAALAMPRAAMPRLAAARGGAAAHAMRRVWRAPAAFAAVASAHGMPVVDVDTPSW